MRHGPAEDRADSGVDADRALTHAGRERVQGVAKLLVEKDERPIRIVSSHLVRAVQTAEIVALTTRLEGNVNTRRELAPGGGPAELVGQLLAEGAKRVMVVGHEPDLSELVIQLVGAFDRPFEKAMVVGVRVSAGEAPSRVRFVIEPKTLRFEAEARSRPVPQD